MIFKNHATDNTEEEEATVNNIELEIHLIVTIVGAAITVITLISHFAGKYWCKKSGSMDLNNRSDAEACEEAATSVVQLSHIASDGIFIAAPPTEMKHIGEVLPHSIMD